MIIKTIDVQAKEWFNNKNGISYFAAIVTLNFGMEDQKTINVPFQSGYGKHHLIESFRQLQMDGYLSNDDTLYNPSRYCKENNITLRNSIKIKCTQKEVKDFVKY